MPPNLRSVGLRRARVPVRTEVHPYPLADANSALDDLAHGRFEGAAVLTVA